VDKFIQKAAVSNIAEIQLGQLAQQKAQDPEVKQFAQKMVDAHEKAQRQLEEVAGSAGVSLPSGLDEKHQRIQAKLDKLNGAEFDREYMKVIVDAHKDAEKLMRRRLEPPAPPPGDIGGAGSGTGAGTGAGTSGGGTAGTTGGTTTGGTTTGGSSGTTGATGTGGTGASGTSGRASPTARAVDDYAAMALPDVQQHLQEAKNLEKRIKDEGKNKDRDK
jgi:putative membrane protein